MWEIEPESTNASLFIINSTCSRFFESVYLLQATNNQRLIVSAHKCAYLVPFRAGARNSRWLPPHSIIAITSHLMLLARMNHYLTIGPQENKSKHSFGFPGTTILTSIVVLVEWATRRRGRILERATPALSSRLSRQIGYLHRQYSWWRTPSPPSQLSKSHLQSPPLPSS